MKRIVSLLLLGASARAFESFQEHNSCLRDCKAFYNFVQTVDVQAIASTPFREAQATLLQLAQTMKSKDCLQVSRSQFVVFLSDYLSPIYSECIILSFDLFKEWQSSSSTRSGSSMRYNNVILETLDRIIINCKQFD